MLGMTYYSLGLLSILHLALLVLAAIQLRQHGIVDHITVFPWIMLLVYGHPVFAGIVLLIVLSRLLSREYITRPPVKTIEWGWPALQILIFVGVQFGLWWWLNTHQLHVGYGDPIWYGMLTVSIGVALVMSHLALMVRPVQNAEKASWRRLFDGLAMLILELLISLFLWGALISTFWVSLYDSWMFVLPPFWVFGLLAALLTYTFWHTEAGQRRAGLWQYAPGVMTFLWSALIVLVPIAGPLAQLLVYPQLSKRH